MNWEPEFEILRAAGFAVAPGLSFDELARAEAVVGAPFPPDLRDFLAEGLPEGERFPDWRQPTSSQIRGRLDWPSDGAAFDVVNDAFWWKGWGTRPVDSSEAVARARAELAGVPRLTPVYAHRYLPAEPNAAGNPVFSVYQTDVIYYGRDLRDYLLREFAPHGTTAALRGRIRRVRFWSDLEELD